MLQSLQNKIELDKVVIKSDYIKNEISDSLAKNSNKQEDKNIVGYSAYEMINKS